MPGIARRLRLSPRAAGGADGSLDDLVAASASGNTAAFEQLYDATAPRVLGLVVRVLQDRAQSEEVTQEVYLEAWRTADRFDAARGNAVTWLLTLAHGRAVDRVRSAAAARTREEKAGIRDQNVPYDEVSEQVETRMEHEQLRRCLTSLSDVQRESLQLAYFGGRTYPEVAAELDVPLGTIKTRMRDGLIRLRDCLGGPA